MNRKSSPPPSSLLLFLAAVQLAVLCGCGGEGSPGGPAEGAAGVTPLKLSVSAQGIVPESTGARPGVWTTDLAAARKAAAEGDLPILLCFTGSDWCKPCRKLTEEVLTRDAWKSWTAGRLLLVYLDFPRDPRRLPGKLLEQNQALQKEFEVQSFPTLILLDSRANYINPVPLAQDNTPESVLRPIRTLLYRCEANVRKTIDRLPAEDTAAAVLKNELARIDETRKTLDRETDAFRKRQQELNGLLQEHSQKMQLAMTELALRKVSPEQRRRYDETKKLYVETQRNLQEWLKTNPQQSQDNLVTYSDFLKTIQDQKNILDDIVNP